MTSSIPACWLIAPGVAALLVAQLWAAAPLDGYRVQFPDAPMPVFTNTPAPDSGLLPFANVALVSGGSVVTNVPGVGPVHPQSTNGSGQVTFRLLYSAIGHTVTGDRPDLYIGDAFPVPTNGTFLVDWAAMALWNATHGIVTNTTFMTNTTVLDSVTNTNVVTNSVVVTNGILSSVSDGFLVVEDGLQAVYAGQGGTMTVTWILTNATTTTKVFRTNTYNVGSAPQKRPSRIFWTEPPYNAPAVNLGGRFVRFHWNEAIPALTTQLVTNANGAIRTNNVRGLWLDSSGNLHAAPGPTNDLQGMVVMQYFKTGAMDQQVGDGVVVVEVSRPQVNTLPATIGSRLLPLDNPYGADGLVARITKGLGDPAYLYQHQGKYAHSPKDGWLFPIQSTVGAPWNIEVYWEEADFMGTRWPYELDWYEADWPAGAQVFVRGHSPSLGADVLIDPSLGPRLMEYQEPPGHAQLLSDGTFRTALDGPTVSPPVTQGFSLLQFSGQDQQGNDNVWFQAVRSVFFDSPAFSGFRSPPSPWPIGTEIQPVIDSFALAFDGVTNYAKIVPTTDQPLPDLNTFSVSGWFQVPGAADGLLKPILTRRRTGVGPSGSDLGSPFLNDLLEWMIAVEPDGTVSASVRTEPPTPMNAGIARIQSSAPLVDNAWHHFQWSVTRTPPSPSTTPPTVQVRLQIDGGFPVTTNAGWIAKDASLGTTNEVWVGTDGAQAHFRGKLDNLQITSPGLNLWLGLPMTELNPGTTTNDPPTLADVAGSEAGRVTVPVYGAELVAPGAPSLQYPLQTNLSANHNYVYLTNGQSAPFNPALYVPASGTNRAPESYVYGVNSGLVEVWWLQQMQQDLMPTPVFFPARPQVYTNLWPVDAAPIVLASGLGGPPIQAVDSPIVYSQPDPTTNGYNPNEEHALVSEAGTGWIPYALRNDLNVTHASPDFTSEPFVLVQYEDPALGQPAMTAFKVVRTNAVYPTFTYPVIAGNPINGPAPLSLLSPVAPTYVSQGPGWRDRTLTWWAVGAGAGLDGTHSVSVHPYYPKQSDFWFPELPPNLQPPDGTPIPWLPTVQGQSVTPSSSMSYPTNGTPVEVEWTVTWPANAPTMQVGQTLTTAINGLPDVWDQLSVDVVYQQSTNARAPFSTDHPTNSAVKLFDPTITRTATLAETPDALGFQYGDVSAPGYLYDRQGLVYFRALPPDLSDRVYYDPTTGNLSLVGQMSATTPSYLLLNALSEGQRSALVGLGTNGLTQEALQSWSEAVNALPRSVPDLEPNQPFDHAALAAIGTGAGYVTLAFNNATNPVMGVEPGDPITLSVIQVETNLYSGFVVPLEDPVNLLSDQMNILFSESMGSEVDGFEFEWFAQEPLPNGSVPTALTNLPPANWPTPPYTNGTPGITRLLIGGEGATIENMVDKFFAVHYRAVTTNTDVIKVVGTNWSQATAWNLAEGWVQRVLNALTPFQVRLRDLYDNPVETWGSMLQQAGPPYDGPIALNMDAIDSVGLIQLYSTVRDRALKLYNNSTSTPDSAANQQLLLAASRLHALYMMLGNEAYADALDPTIGFGNQPALPSGGLPGVDYGAVASSLFCFDNQMPSLLDEELALLRGRGDASTAPGVGTGPYYNRLFWNFTKGIDAGEVAYAVNYNIHDPDAANISAGTAMQLYPQGHGDAWGHYLSALRGYLDLLALPGFQWFDSNELPMLLDPVFLPYTVETGAGDTKRIAEATSALVRTGVEIARRATRKAYTAGALGPLPGSVDADTNRAWGVTEWSARTGMAALYGWALTQSLLPPPSTAETNTIEASLLAVDRLTLRESDEIIALYRVLQQQTDGLDQGLNPLGIPDGSVPFDINPSSVADGQTHFEQVYARAVTALQNAAAAFDAAQDAGRQLRKQAESAAQFKQSMEDQEASFNSQLIALYGYPYANDIGPAGTYPDGYNGPDLIHYAYLDLEALGFDRDVDIGSPLTLTNYAVSRDLLSGGGTVASIAGNTNAAVMVTFHVARNGLLSKPPGWTAPRRAEGALQQAYRDHLSAVLAYQNGLTAWQGSVSGLQAAYDWYHGDGQWYDQQSALLKASIAVPSIDLANATGEAVTATAVNAAKQVYWAIKANLQPSKEAFPLSLIVGAADGGDETSTLRAALSRVTITSEWLFEIFKDIKEEAALLSKLAAASAAEAQKVLSAKSSFAVQDHEAKAGILTQAGNVGTAAANLLTQYQAMAKAQERFLSLTAQGEELQAERATVRTNAASRLAQGRYNDMAFRIFRNDALQRYGDAFELAARYAYLAVQAYDYETCLLSSTNLPQSHASQYLDAVVRARTVGRLDGGQPGLGAGLGDPGLADVLARLNANWQVLKGRLGFNNPDPETTYFSLRNERFCILNGTTNNLNWRDCLWTYRVDNLFDHPVFRQYCLPFAAEGGLQSSEPGLVIPFSTTVNFGENFFGNPLAAGQNSYDSSHFATKIRGVGVWFTGYDTATNSALARQPRVYLIPTGQDTMRSPSGDGTWTRSWKVVDQAIPIPFPVGDELNSSDWIAVHDSLPGPWGVTRRHASLRAYQDHGFSLADLTYNSRLIGRSVWNDQWYLIIPAGTLGSDREGALDAFLNSVTDIKLYFQTYSYSGN